MEKEKFYVPSIEEFHIGFEYEFLTGGVNWNPFVFDLDRPERVLANVKEKPEMFRIKYLDDEDILSLGWEKEAIEMFSIAHALSAEDYFIEKQDGKWNIYVQQNTMDYTGNYDVMTLFFGTIKNKSELRRIMEMVGINTK